MGGPSAWEKHDHMHASERSQQQAEHGFSVKYKAGGQKGPQEAVYSCTSISEEKRNGNSICGA